MGERSGTSILYPLSPAAACERGSPSCRVECCPAAAWVQACLAPETARVIMAQLFCLQYLYSCLQYNTILMRLLIYNILIVLFFRLCLCFCMLQTYKTQPSPGATLLARAATLRSSVQNYNTHQV